MTKKAAALKYDKTCGVPIVSAIGFGQVAEKIIQTANDSSVPIIQNDELVENLSTLQVGDTIPIELYEAVAEVIAFIYSLNDKIDDKKVKGIDTFVD